MPIVISHTDIKALGALAMQAGAAEAARATEAAERQAAQRAGEFAATQATNQANRNVDRATRANEFNATMATNQANRDVDRTVRAGEFSATMAANQATNQRTLDEQRRREGVYRDQAAQAQANKVALLGLEFQAGKYSRTGGKPPTATAQAETLYQQYRTKIPPPSGKLNRMNESFFQEANTNQQKNARLLAAATPETLRQYLDLWPAAPLAPYVRALIEHHRRTSAAQQGTGGVPRGKTQVEVGVPAPPGGEGSYWPSAPAGPAEPAYPYGYSSLPPPPGSGPQGSSGLADIPTEELLKMSEEQLRKRLGYLPN